MLLLTVNHHQTTMGTLREVVVAAARSAARRVGETRVAAGASDYGRDAGVSKGIIVQLK
jgi:hypothetical protein